MDHPHSLTSVSLLGKVCCTSADDSAWSEFVERYAPRIYLWCQQYHLQQADAEDVTQNVLSTLFRRLSRFSYDPKLSFRNWLRKVTRDSIQDFFRSRQSKEAGIGGSEVSHLLDTIEARKQLEQHFEELFDLELLAEASARVEQRLQPNRWQAYAMTAIEGRPGAEVAAKLGMKVAVVYSAKSKVQQMIRREIANMEGVSANTVTVSTKTKTRNESMPN